jgi:hypothetical protein
MDKYSTGKMLNVVLSVVFRENVSGVAAKHCRPSH